MSVDVEVKGFTGPYAHWNAPSRALPIGMAELVNKAITVGGLPAGSPRQRTLRRAAIASTVLSCVQPTGAGGKLMTTGLYNGTETTEKGGISFRLGMAFAAAVAGRVLGMKQLAHIPASSKGGRRADLYGKDRLDRRHVVEAKCRSHGIDAKVKRDAKAQTRASLAALRAEGKAVETGSASLTDLTDRISVLFTDPPEGESGKLSFGGFSEERFFAEYYSPVEDLLEVTGASASEVPEIDRFARGAWLPGGVVWLGLSRGAQEAEGRDPTPLSHISSDGHAVVLAPGTVEWDREE